RFNLGQAEKDYYQEIILFILYSEFGKELIFKGGTALTKCFGFDRFSEDLDFTASKELDIKKTLIKGLKNFYIDFTLEERMFLESKNMIIKIKGPLYNGNNISLCKISLDISIREQ